MAVAEAGDDHKRLRRIADSLLTKAEEGDVSAIREVADRLDGKVPQTLEGNGENGAIQVRILHFNCE